MPSRYSVITGTGSYIPEIVKTNRDFNLHDFYTEEKERIDRDPKEITDKFQQITGIEERRYAQEHLNTSEIGAIAAKRAIDDSGVDPESLDQIIVAHNFGNVPKHSNQPDTMPSIASRIKHELNIHNPSCVAYDVLFGCPGWVQGVIHADAFFKAGVAKKCLVVGADTLSRLVDNYDRDSMIFSDGAGASVLEYLAPENEERPSGILSSSVQSHCLDEAYYLFMGPSNFPDSDPRQRFIKMKGRKVYEFAMKNVPKAMKDCLERSGATIDNLKKVFIHQANEKMDEGIIRRLYREYGIKDIPPHIMPMSIHKLGNSSVATIPTLLDMVNRNQLENHALNKGDVILLSSVGAGMNINAVTYRV